MKKICLCRVLAVLLALAMAVSLAACGQQERKAPTEYSLSLNQTSLTLVEDAQAVLTATAQPDGQVSWSTSDETVVSVSSGTLFAKKAGNATVTASIGGATATCQVTVTAQDGSFLYLEPSQSCYAVEIGGQTQPVAFSLYQVAADGTRTEVTGQDITYTLENEKLAALEGDRLTGTVSGVTAVTAQCGTYSATAEVRIYDQFIATAEDWCKMLSSRTLGESYLLTADIDFAGKSYTGPYTGAPAAVKAQAFRGTLDGNGHTVKNIRLAGSGYVSLFGQLYSAQIRDINFENVEISGGNASGLATCIAGQNTLVENISLELRFENVGNALLHTAYGGTVRNVLLTAQASSEIASIGRVQSLQTSGIYLLAENGAAACEGIAAFTSKMELVAAVNSQRLLPQTAWSYPGGPELPTLINE